MSDDEIGVASAICMRKRPVNKYVLENESGMYLQKKIANLNARSQRICTAVLIDSSAM